MADFIYTLEDVLDFLVSTWFICFIGKYLFLKDYTEKQKRTLQLLFYVSGIAVIFQLIVCLFGYQSILRVLFVVIGLICMGYANIAGRKKRKWLGIFFVIPLTGYGVVLSIFTETAKSYLSLSLLHKNLICIIFEIALLLVMFYLSNEKIRPELLNTFERDIKNMRYTAKEAVGLWLIGISLLIYDWFRPQQPSEGIWIFKDMTPGIKIFDDILIFAFGIVITFFIINSSYRRYYYEKNLKYQKTLITTMANLVESRDDNTGGHIHRTAKYVEIIARKLKSEGKFGEILTDKYINDMVVAAPLHDVGKIHISDVVLNKPGRLDEDEFAQIKSHSAAGGEIISQVEKEVGEDISYLDIAKDMAEYHHERMDGKGYPHGIKGDEIPICARILAVADVFDALVSKRCYKAAMPLDKAYAIIKEETGDHFDVDVAQAFLDSKEEVEQFLNEIAVEENVGNTAEAN